MVDGVPDRAARIIAFLNTRDVDLGGDALATPEGLHAWLREERGYQGPPPSLRQMGAASRLREALRDLLARHGAAEAAPAVPADALNAWLAKFPVRFAAAPDGAFEVLPPGSDIVQALAGIAADAVLCQGSPAWLRIKVCQNPDCRWAYYDRSHSATQKWCSMAGCGNRLKARRHRRRKALASGRVMPPDSEGPAEN